MNPHPAEATIVAGLRWVLHPGSLGGQVPPPTLVGGKAHNLARLAAAGAEVPEWVVVTADAFRAVALRAYPPPSTPEQADAWQARVREIELPAALAREIDDALRAAGLSDRLLAVRSSAVSEDGADHSFAGQFDSLLGVRPAEVLEALRRVWASAGNRWALEYGAHLAPMAVVIQAMVDAEASGVAFGADPVGGRRDVAVVSAVPGLGEGLVSGLLDADTFHVDFASEPPSVRATLVRKEEAVRLLPEGGTRRVALEAPGGQPVATLTEKEVVRIAEATRRIGVALGAPQDVEWALEGRGAGRRLLILQARPITTLPATPPEEGERRVWDNSNIVESYSGVTSPLTFSFARGVYEEVYRQFCAVVGVPSHEVERQRHVFANMLGLVKGRVYYNLLNWYRTLALLPGYAVNRSFMEQMMGVRDKLENPPSQRSTSGRGVDALRLVRMTYRLTRESRRLSRSVPAFHARVERVLAPLAREDFGAWSADRLVALYRRLEDELLRNWQTPLVNDFFAMIWFGVLGRLVTRWVPDAPPTLINDLLTHEGGIVSTEPARRVMELARQVRADPALLAHFAAERPAAEIRARIEADPACGAFRDEVRRYLERFGDRCMQELKLETITLSEDPTFLYQTVRDYVAGGVEPPDPAREAEVRLAAEARVERALSGVRLRLFRGVLAQARARVRDRENLRFERTRVFGAVRRIFLGLGHSLHRSGRLADPRDIFFLRVEEIFAHVEGTATLSALDALVALRKREWEEYATQPAPPDRFESVGPVELGRWIVPRTDAIDTDGDALQGIGCCPGVVRAPVRLVRDPADAGDLSGHILVAERTDPGWTLLFPVARGLLVERGSLLSHSAIVAREVGLPCVVSIPGLLATLRDGEVVEMDGTTGQVRRLHA